MDLVAATHGRGIYKLNLRPLQLAVRETAEKSVLQEKKIFPPPPGRLPRFGDTHREPIYKTLEKVPFTFLWDREEKVTLEIRNGKGQLVWSREYQAAPGFNQFRWDLVVKRVASKLPYFIHYDHFILPGRYKIILKGGETQLETDWEVMAANNFPRYPKN